jgi:hypothetical protein
MKKPPPNGGGFFIDDRSDQRTTWKARAVLEPSSERSA